jgi:hypothetical protein
MIQDIRKTQLQLESESETLLASVVTKALSDEEISTLLSDNAEKNRLAYLQLFKSLLFKYADGYINTWAGRKFVSANAGYPTWWLHVVGYEDGPGPAELGLLNQPKQTETDAVVAASHSAARVGTADLMLDKCLQTCLGGKQAELRRCALRCL